MWVLRDVALVAADAVGRGHRARQVLVEPHRRVRVVEGAAAVAGVREEGDLARPGGALEVLHAHEADAGEERRPEDVRREGPAGLPREVGVIGIAHRERQVHAREVRAGRRGDVGVGRERGVERVDGVALVRQRDAEVGVVERLELVGLLDQDLPQSGPVLCVVGFVLRGDVVEGQHQVDQVLVTGRVVPPHHPVLGDDAERVRPGGVEARVGLGGHEPDVALRGGDPAPEQRVEDILRRIALRHVGRLGPVGLVDRRRRVVELGHEGAVLAKTGGVEEHAAGGVAAPWVGRLVALDDAGHLQAGIEHVLVAGALGPVATTDRRRVGRVDAHLATGVQAVVDAVDGDRAGVAGKEPVAAGGRTLGRGIGAGVRRGGQRDGGGKREQHSADQASRTTQ